MVAPASLEGEILGNQRDDIDGVTYLVKHAVGVKRHRNPLKFQCGEMIAERAGNGRDKGPGRAGDQEKSLMRGAHPITHEKVVPLQFLLLSGLVSVSASSFEN
jgi:hypothetical protein